jgi:threonyl-tRNA synthetase
MISFLIEFYGGAFPTWMAPVQVRLIPVNDEVLDYARNLESKLRSVFFRADIDTSDESFNKKIRNAVTRKIPNIWILGKQEAEQGSITWRRHAVKDQKSLPVADAMALLEILRTNRTMDNFADVAIWQQ